MGLWVSLCRGASLRLEIQKYPHVSDLLQKKTDSTIFLFRQNIKKGFAEVEFIFRTCIYNLSRTKRHNPERGIWS